MNIWSLTLLSEKIPITTLLLLLRVLHHNTIKFCLFGMMLKVPRSTAMVMSRMVSQPNYTFFLDKRKYVHVVLANCLVKLAQEISVVRTKVSLPSRHDHSC